MHAGLRSARSKSTGSSGELDDARSSQVKSHVSARIGTRFARVLSGGELFYWLAPLIVVLELVGSVFDAPVPATLCFLALFVGALWLAPDVFAPGEAERRWPRRVLGVLALLAGASAFSFGVLRFASPENLPKLELPRWLSSAEWRILLPVAGAYALSLTPSLLRGKRLGPRDHERMGILIALAFIVMLDSRIRVQSLLVLPYQTPTGGIVLRIAGGLLLLLLVVPRLSTGVRLLLLIVAALAVRVVGLGAWELDPVTRDMLPLAKSAQDGFFRGENPYAIYQMQRGSEVPLTYLPGMWLIHGIPRLFGADLRFLGVAVDAIVAGSLWWAAGAVSPRFIERARGFVIGFSAVWLFSPSVHWNGIYAEPHAWWGVLAILLAAVMRRSWWIAAAALGVALATRQFAAVVAPFVLIALIKDLGFKQALPRIAVTGTLAAQARLLRHAVSHRRHRVDAACAARSGARDGSACAVREGRARVHRTGGYRLRAVRDVQRHHLGQFLSWLRAFRGVCLRRRLRASSARSQGGTRAKPRVRAFGRAAGIVSGRIRRARGGAFSSFRRQRPQGRASAAGGESTRARCRSRSFRPAPRVRQGPVAGRTARARGTVRLRSLRALVRRARSARLRATLARFQNRSR
jgi:hypothetical protein